MRTKNEHTHRKAKANDGKKEARVHWTEKRADEANGKE